MNFETVSLILFFLLLLGFVIIKRKKIQMQKLLFPLFYLLLYRTKLGIKLMHSSAEKHPKFLKIAGILGIVVGYAGMIYLSIMLFYQLIISLISPLAPALALVVPFKMKGGVYVPFFYWIVSIVLLAAIHEFSHGVMAALAKVKIKSSGFAFMSILLPIIPAAFVEPDEKQIAKRSKIQQLSILAAGPFSNILAGVFALVLIMLVSFPISTALYDFDGAEVVDYFHINETQSPLEIAGVEKGEVIKSINNVQLNHVANFSDYLDELKPGESINLTTSRQNYELVLAENPLNDSKPYLGIYLNQNYKLKERFSSNSGKIFASVVTWINGKYLLKGVPLQYGLLFWFFLLNLGIGLFNLIPIGPVDGGRMFYIAMLKFFDKKKALKITGIVSTFFILIILFNLFIGFLF